MCPYCRDPRCFQDRHHIYWPRKAYRTKLERTFRQTFIQRMWRCQHDDMHARRPPFKPNRGTMIEMLKKRGVALAD